MDLWGTAMSQPRDDRQDDMFRPALEPERGMINLIANAGNIKLGHGPHISACDGLRISSG
jgi:hypothetical protein